MKVQSLCLVSNMPRYPQALQEFPMVCFLGLMCYNDKNIWSNFKGTLINNLYNNESSEKSLRQITQLLNKASCTWKLQRLLCCHKNVCFSLYTGVYIDIGIYPVLCLMTLKTVYKADCRMKQKPGQLRLCKISGSQTVLHCRGKSVEQSRSFVLNWISHLITKLVICSVLCHSKPIRLF